MNATIFDTLEAMRTLEAAGIERRQAEACVEALRDAVSADRDILATKGDLKAFEGDLDALEGRITATLHRALWIQGGAIIAILTALRFFPIRPRCAPVQAASACSRNQPRRDLPRFAWMIQV